MSETADRERREERHSAFFSCAFCHSESPKPFKICETCGSSQPASKEDEEE